MREMLSNLFASIFMISFIFFIFWLWRWIKPKNKHAINKPYSKKRVWQSLAISIASFILCGLIRPETRSPTYSNVQANNITFDTNSDGKYVLSLSSDKKSKIKVESSQYINNVKYNGNEATVYISVPSNLDKVKVNYSASGEGERRYNDSLNVYNKSTARQELLDGRVKEKQQKEAQYKAQHPPIESVLRNPLNATQEQQARSYMIKGKVVDMAGLETGMQYIVQDSEGNKFFTFVNKGGLKGGPRANLNDQLTIYAENIFPDTITQNEVNNGMIASHVGEKVTNALADKVYLKREE